jgi:hypothetical protein
MRQGEKSGSGAGSGSGRPKTCGSGYPTLPDPKEINQHCLRVERTTVHNRIGSLVMASAVHFSIQGVPHRPVEQEPWGTVLKNDSLFTER